MTDQQLALQAVSEAQRIREEYLEPRPHNHERILDRLVEVLERPDLVVALDRLQRSNGWGSQEKPAGRFRRAKIGSPSRPTARRPTFPTRVWSMRQAGSRFEANCRPPE